MDTRRHSERRETLAYWPAEQVDTGERVGLVTNLSEEGIQIHSNHGFEQGNMITLRIAVDPVLCGTDDITVVVENVWCRASGIPDLYHAGFRAVDVSDRARESLNRLFQAYSYPAPGEPEE